MEFVTFLALCNFMKKNSKYRKNTTFIFIEMKKKIFIANYPKSYTSSEIEDKFTSRIFAKYFFLFTSIIKHLKNVLLEF